MTISIRISKTEPHKVVEQDGLIAAFAGSKGYVPQGSTDVEIVADNEFDSASEAAGWVEEIAIVASSTFRHAAYGETAFVGEIEDEEDNGLPKIDDHGRVTYPDEADAPEPANGPDNQPIRVRIDDPAELDDLPVGSVVVDSDGDAWQRRKDAWKSAAAPHGSPHHYPPLVLVYRGSGD